MKYLVFVAYYIYCLILVLATGYVVFWLHQSGWWFLVTILLAQNGPEFKENREGTAK